MSIPSNLVDAGRWLRWVAVTSLFLMAILFPFQNAANAADRIWRYAEGEHGTWYYMARKNESYRQTVVVEFGQANAWSTNGITAASGNMGVVQHYARGRYKSGCGWSNRYFDGERFRTECTIFY